MQKRNIGLFTLARDGTKIPFDRRGARVHVTPDAWIEIDFAFDAFAPVAVTIGGRARKTGEGMPHLTIEPHAGNVLTIVAGAGRRADASSRRVIAVESARDSDQAVLDTDTFLVEYGDLAEIQIKLVARDDALLGIDVRCDFRTNSTLGTFGRGLHPFVVPQAANLLSLWFAELGSFNAGS